MNSPVGSKKPFLRLVLLSAAAAAAWVVAVVVTLTSTAALSWWAALGAATAVALMVIPWRRPWGFLWVAVLAWAVAPTGWAAPGSDASYQLGFYAAGMVLFPAIAAAMLVLFAASHVDAAVATEPPARRLAPIVGLNGFAGAGKDTAAAGLLEDGWTRVSFADKLREFLYALNPLVAVVVPLPLEGEAEPRFTPTGFPLRTGREYRPLRDIVDDLGWDRAKNEHPDVRALLQRCGTDAGRNVLGEDVWVDAVMRSLPAGPVVITDVRFPNEFAAIKRLGGAVYRVERPGVGPVNGHPSEYALEDADFDGWLHNTGDETHLRESLRGLVDLHQSA